MAKEAKKYGLRATKRPAKNSLVSSVCAVQNERGEQGYCYINFDAPFVTKVGNVLPRGVSYQDPAMIIVRYYSRTKVWLVLADYIAGGSETLLWRTADRPEWLNFYKVKKHDHQSQRSAPPRAYHPEQDDHDCL